MKEQRTENKTFEIKNNNLVALLYGEHNAHLSHIEKKLEIDIADRGNILTISGTIEATKQAQKVLQSLVDKLEQEQEIGIAEIDAAIRFSSPARAKRHKANGKKQMTSGDLVISTKNKSISPRNPNQARYLEAILNNEMVFGLGPAGTGKTYLAVAAGVSMYLSGKIERLIFCRPALEAGENLGFLPGDMQEKVDPYLRPIYDALNDMIPWDLLVKKMEVGEIEVAPLAFMRGRTLSNAFVILDEAQNTTCAQMKMFLTRMGESSRMVITGDTSQSDLPRNVKSGLNDAIEILENVEDIKFCEFTNKDVVRHKLVGKIVHAYDTHNK